MICNISTTKSLPPLHYTQMEIHNQKLHNVVTYFVLLSPQQLWEIVGRTKYAEDRNSNASI